MNPSEIAIFMMATGTIIVAEFETPAQLENMRKGQAFTVVNPAMAGRNAQGIAMIPLIPWTSKGDSLRFNFQAGQIAGDIPVEGGEGMVADYKQMFSPIDLSAAGSNVVGLIRT